MKKHFVSLTRVGVAKAQSTDELDWSIKLILPMGILTAMTAFAAAKETSDDG